MKHTERISRDKNAFTFLYFFSPLQYTYIFFWNNINNNINNEVIIIGNEVFLVRLRQSIFYCKRERAGYALYAKIP